MCAFHYFVLCAQTRHRYPRSTGQSRGCSQPARPNRNSAGMPYQGDLSRRPESMKDDLIDYIKAHTATDAPMRPEGSLEKIRVLIADDHTILRAGLKIMLNAQPDIETIGEASDGKQAITEVERLAPDVVIMDITMPECNGIEATRQIKRMLPDVRVLILTMHENEEYLFETLRAGAAGYMLKEAADTELISAIRVVSSGRFYLSPSAQSMLVSDY